MSTYLELIEIETQKAYEKVVEQRGDNPLHENFEEGFKNNFREGFEEGVVAQIKNVIKDNVLNDDEISEMFEQLQLPQNVIAKILE